MPNRPALLQNMDLGMVQIWVTLGRCHLGCDFCPNLRFGNKNQHPVIQEQKYVPWPLDHGTLHFLFQDLWSWGKWAVEMTSKVCNPQTPSFEPRLLLRTFQYTLTTFNPSG